MPTDLPFAYQIRRSHRVANARIVVKPGRVEVVAPLLFPEQKLHRFVQAKQQWIVHALGKMAMVTPEQGGFLPHTFQSDAMLVYQGKPYPVTLITSNLKRVKIEFDEGYRITVPSGFSPEEQDIKIRDALVNWLKKQIRPIVEQMVAHYAPQKKLFPRSIAIKTQKSRWGSCGIHDDININWLLLLAPVDVLAYVVVHEICHIKVKNHSPKFWALVAEHMPDYQVRRNWLKKQGRSLMVAFNR